MYGQRSCSKSKSCSVRKKLLDAGIELATRCTAASSPTTILATTSNSLCVPQTVVSGLGVICMWTYTLFVNAPTTREKTIVWGQCLKKCVILLAVYFTYHNTVPYSRKVGRRPSDGGRGGHKAECVGGPVVAGLPGRRRHAGDARQLQQVRRRLQAARRVYSARW